MPKHKIETLRAKIAPGEAEIAHELSVELAVLPKQFGFSSVAEFLRAVMKAAGGGKKQKRPLRKSAAARERNAGPHIAD